MPLFLCRSPNIESNVLEALNVVIYFRGPSAEQHLLNGFTPHCTILPFIRILGLQTLNFSQTPKTDLNVRFRTPNVGMEHGTPVLNVSEYPRGSETISDWLNLINASSLDLVDHERATFSYFRVPCTQAIFEQIWLIPNVRK